MCSINQKIARPKHITYEALGYLGKDQIVFIRNRKLIQRLALAVEPNLTKKNITDILYQLWVYAETIAPEKSIVYENKCYIEPFVKDGEEV